MAPFERDYQSQSGDDDNKHVTIMGLSWGEGERSMPCYGAVINEFGELVDNIKLDRMQDSNIEAKMADHDSLVQFVKRHKVDLIVISGWSINTKTRLFEDVSRIMADRMRGGIQVQLIDDDVARIYMDSKRAIKEFPEKFVRSSLVRYCVSIARRAQDPTMEIAGLCNLDDDIKLLRLHPLQKLVSLVML